MNKNIFLLTLVFVGLSTFAAHGKWKYVSTTYDIGQDMRYEVKIKDIGVGSAQEIWAVGTEKYIRNKDNSVQEKNENVIFRLTNGIFMRKIKKDNKYYKIPGKAKRIAVDSAGQVWCIGTNNKAYQMKSNKSGWNVKHGPFQSHWTFHDIAVEGGKAWAAGSSGAACRWQRGTFFIYRWKGKITHDGAAKTYNRNTKKESSVKFNRISVQHKKESKKVAIGLKTGDVPYIKRDRYWEASLKTNLKLNDIAVGKHCWGIKTDGTPVVRTMDSWQSVRGVKLKSIDSALDGTTWGVTTEGKVVRWEGRVPGAKKIEISSLVSRW